MNYNNYFKSKNITILENPIYNNKIYLYGSNHISPKSSEEIRKLISFIRPDQIFLECCIERWKIIESNKSQNAIINPFPKKFEAGITLINSQENRNLYHKIIQMFKMIFTLIQIIINIIIIYSGIFISNIFSKKEEIDMLTAVEESVKINSLCILGDQRISVTIKDCISVPTIEILKIIFLVSFPLMIKNIINENTINDDNLLLEYWDKINIICPMLYKKLIKKRNNYMMNILSECDGKNIFAIVGKAHVKGIKENWSTFIKYRKKFADTSKKINSDKKKIIEHI